MFRKTLLAVVCLGSFCFADNFLIGNTLANVDGSPSHKAEQEERQPSAYERMPQRVVIEDVNPSSELGQLISVMLKNEQKKAAALSAPKPKPKPVVKKKPVKKKVVRRKTAVHKTEATPKEAHIEVKTEEASKVGEHEKKEADHNENNSSLKKLSSSNICD